jgi:hypothetical protein
MPIDFAKHMSNANRFARARLPIDEQVSRLATAEQVREVAGYQFQISIATKRLSARRI